ncbi:MAG: hypothetical protein PHX21_01135 [bacterium]|nr:hypothetical protein [bacterium]
MTKYASAALFLFCVVVLPNTGCSDSPKNDKSQSNLSANTIDTKKAYNSEGMGTGTNPGSDKESPNIAIEKASKENKYLFLVFYKQDDQKSEKMKQVVAQVERELSGKANFTRIDISNPNAQATIQKYGIDRAPIPITLVMAPNGAVVTGFPDTVNNDLLRNAFVSPKTTEIIKSVQDRKLAYLYIANRGMKYYKANLDLLKETAKVDLQGAANIIEVDPKSEEESSLLKQCGVDASTKEATVLILNCGSVVGNLTGKFVKQILLSRTMSGCSGGSCGGGTCK